MTGDGGVEVVGGDGQGGGLVFRKAGFLHAKQGCALAGVGDVRTGEACGGRGEFGDEVVAVDAVGQLQPLHVVKEDGLAALLVGRTHPYDLVEAARSAEGRVDVFRPVGRGEDEDLAPLLQPVEQGEELCDHGLLVLGIGRPSGQAQAVDLVEEDDGGRVFPGPFEDSPECGLGLAHPFRQQRWAGNNLDVGSALTGYRTGQQALARPRRPGQNRAMRPRGGPSPASM